MEKNINYKRVRTIKAAIYFGILLLLLIPAIVMIVIGVRILGEFDARDAVLARMPSAAGSAASESNDAFGGTSQLPVPDESSGSQGSELIVGGSRVGESSGGAGTSASQSTEPSAPENSGGADTSASQSYEPTVPENSGGADKPSQEGDNASSYPDGQRYGDTEIPNTGFPKPGEMDR